MAKLTDVLMKMLREPIETLVENAVVDGVEDIQKKYDEWSGEKADEIIEDLLDNLPEAVVEYGGAIAFAIKPIVLAALVDGANEVIEYVWRKAQNINPSDADTAAPSIEA